MISLSSGVIRINQEVEDFSFGYAKIIGEVIPKTSNAIIIC